MPFTIQRQTFGSGIWDFGQGYEGWRPRGDDVVSFKVIEPPDDRYIPGYSKTEADGDKKIVMPRLKDLNVPFSLYGLPIPITFGVRRLYGNIIWAIPLKENVKKQTEGGSGGPRKVVFEYEYFATYAVAFGYASSQIAGARDIIRIWLDGTLAYDRRSAGAAKIQGLNFVFYDGSEDQGIDPTIEERETYAPAFRGMMYIVIKDLPVMDFGNRPPAVTIEVGDATGADYSITNIDSNPGDIYIDDRQDELLPDWAYNTAITIRDGEEDAFCRVYDLQNNNILKVSGINEGGIGWENNGADTPWKPNILVYKKGIKALVTNCVYLPDIQRVFASANGIGCAPVMLFDPYTGIVESWCGCDELGVEPKFEETGELLNESGRIPVFRNAGSQYVYSQTAIRYFTFCDNFYSAGGITVFEIVDNYKNTGQRQLRQIQIFDGAKTLQFAPGPRFLEVSYFFGILPSGSIQVFQILMSAFRIRLAKGIHQRSGVFLHSTLSLPSPAQNMVFFNFDNALIVFMQNGFVRKFTFDFEGTPTLAWEKEIGVSNLPPAYQKNMYLNNVEYGSYAYMPSSGSKVIEIDLSFGTVREFDAMQGSFFASTPRFSDSQSKSILGLPTTGSGGYGPGQNQTKQPGLSRGYYDLISDSNVPLADILIALSVYAGYDVADVEVDPAITDMVDGAIITEVSTFRAVVDPICALYRIDIVESDGKIKFRRKSTEYFSDDFTVSNGECLLDSVNEPDGPTFVLRREEEIAVPERVQVRYMDKDLSYNWSMQMATRSRQIVTNDSNTQITYQVPIIMRAEDAKLLAQRALWYTWSSRVSYSFRLSPKFLKIEPGDVGTVQADELEYRVKAVEVSYNNDFSVSIRGTSFQSDEAVSVVTDAPSGYPQEIPIAVPLEMAVFDIPLLRATDDNLANSQFPVYFYVGPTKLNVQFLGGIGKIGFNATSLPDAGVNSVESFVARVSNVPEVREGMINVIDDAIYLDIVPSSGDIALLESVTEEELLAGANAAAWGADGRWEVIQFRDVEEITDSLYRLTGILRGRRGTDFAVGSHVAGDKLVLLNTNSIKAKSFSLSDVGRVMFYTSVPLGLSTSLTPTKSTPLEAYAFKPWIPSGVRAEREIGGDQSITIKWNRRSRTFGNLLANYESIPLGQFESNDYKITVYRRNYYSYEWNAELSTWVATTEDESYAEFFVTDATEITLTATQQRDMDLFEFESPDDVNSLGTAFTVVNGSNHPDNVSGYQQQRDLGFTQWHAFKFIDVMVQQKYTLSTGVPGSPVGYGPGRRIRIYIEDL